LTCGYETDKTAALWDVKTGARLATFDHHEGRPVCCVALSRDGRLAASGAYDGSISVFRLPR
jgi:WD40 repeat protein